MGCRKLSSIPVLFSLDLNTQGESCGGISVSPSGRYYSVGHNVIGKDGKQTSWYELIRRSDGQVIGRQDKPYRWMPVHPAPAQTGKKKGKAVAAPAERYWYTRPGVQGRDLVADDPETGRELTWATDIPEGNFRFVPGGRYLIYSLE